MQDGHRTYPHHRNSRAESLFPLCFGYHGNLLSVKGFGSSVGKKSACNAGNPGSIPGWRRSHGEGIGYPLQYSWASLVAQMVRIRLQCRRPGFHPWVGKISCRRERLPTQYSGLENSMDCIVYGVTKSRTQLSDFHFHFQKLESGRR